MCFASDSCEVCLVAVWVFWGYIAVFSGLFATKLETVYTPLFKA
jgi:hypothetical protein